MRRIIPALSVALVLALFAPLGALASAQEQHPGHVQQEFGDGPADEDNGVGRGNPNGNNGTIKLDGVDLFGKYDNHPNNEPHIGCEFEVDLYGFDEGDTAVLEFREWNPTATKEPIHTLDVEVDGEGIGDDGAGGGVDLDDDQLVSLTNRVIGEPHPHHGHHIRLDAIITSGDDTYKKTKVFWTGVCGSGPATETP